MQRSHSFHSAGTGGSDSDADDQGGMDGGADSVSQRLVADERARKALLDRVQGSRKAKVYERARHRPGAGAGAGAGGVTGGGTGAGAPQHSGRGSVSSDGGHSSDDATSAADNTFQRVVITGAMDVTPEHAKVCRMVGAALKLRQKYIFRKPQQYWGGVNKEDFERARSIQRTRSTGSSDRRGLSRSASLGHAPPRSATPLGGDRVPTTTGGMGALILPAAGGGTSEAGGSVAGDAMSTAATAGSASVVDDGAEDSSDDAGNEDSDSDVDDDELLSGDDAGVVVDANGAPVSRGEPQTVGGVDLGVVGEPPNSPAHATIPEPTAAAVATRALHGDTPPLGPEPRGPGSNLSDSVGSVRRESRHYGVPRRPPPLIAFSGKVAGPSQHAYRMVNGVVMVYRVSDDGTEQDEPESHMPSFDEFQRDYSDVVKLIHFAPFKSFAFKRMQLLQARFDLHKLLNAEKELSVQKVVPHRDFYNVWKVDTHVHHSACMNQKTMLRFIKRKLRHFPNEVVIFRDGQFLTLAEVFKSLSISAYDLSIDTLDMHADSTTFHRFDRFNLKYNPCGQSRLREIFLKSDNLIAGRYLAEITKQVFDELERSKYQLAEYRVSVYGRKPSEWDKLARWVWVHRLASPNVRWLIQVPRLYEVYKKTGQVHSFQDMLDHIFLPLFAVSVDPSSNPMLHHFLRLVVGFDCVDDESKHELKADAGEHMPPPAEWTNAHSPPYFYWVYYLAANLQTLNQLRASKGMSTFSFRPHSGEAGDVSHLAATFLTAESINHGITMRKSPALQYLYYLTQIGLAMSPLSNNKLFVDYHRNPFHTYFACGLNVSLSTDDPLILHYTREPLVEEYCVAAQVWKLSSTDMCEIARNSVLQSGFEHPYKSHYIGDRYFLPGPAGNNIRYTNVPNIRLKYRYEVLRAEHEVITFAALQHLPAGSKAPAPAPLPPSAHPPPVPTRGAVGGRSGSGDRSAYMPRHPTPRFAGPPQPPTSTPPTEALAAPTAAAATIAAAVPAADAGTAPMSPPRVGTLGRDARELLCRSPLGQIMATNVKDGPPTLIALPPPRLAPEAMAAVSGTAVPHSPAYAAAVAAAAAASAAADADNE